ncbi:MAG TPA: hypothetical protein VK737_04090 [Opitutales bacterium]|jgi:hypothetical protein|nr:hypothetical protein [Opitutales bacterium]
MPQSNSVKPRKDSDQDASTWRAAEAAGVDMSLLEHSLRLSPWERLVEHQRAFELVQTLQNAKIKPSCKT